MEQSRIREIIKEITPLYNQYKRDGSKINGKQALYIIWEIGNILKKGINDLNLPPHNLYRKIYGKAEGSTDIVQKSYITREFLGRAYRIRNIFKDKDDITKELPNLKKFILFREAMPFFDNEKYKLGGEERKKLLLILNSRESSLLIMKKIKLLQSEKIGKKNSRNQKLNELEEEKKIFISFYNYLFNIIKNFEYIDIKKDIPFYNSSIVAQLSSSTSCLAQEGLKFPEILEKKLDSQWDPFVKMLKKFSSQKDAKERRRFRRLIPPERIARLADMLQAITSEDSFRNFKV